MYSVFNCTQCGKCCHNLNIPLSIEEAKAWLLSGHQLKILTEAIPWVNDTPLTEDVLIRKKTMTFAGSSGDLSIRVLMTFVGFFKDACPNLDSNYNCKIYDTRPLTCRIYPFEMNPKIKLDPTKKLCPSEAWESTSNQKTSISNHKIVIIDQATQKDIEEIYTQSVTDAEIKGAICNELGIKTCSLSNNGYLFHLVDQHKLLSTIEKLTTDTHTIKPNEQDTSNWTIYSANEETLNDLKMVGAYATIPTQSSLKQEEFISL